MSIRSRITLSYLALLLVSLFFMTGALFVEWKENFERAQQGQPPGPMWEEIGEIVIFYGLPTAVLLLVGGWIVIRRALAPLPVLTKAMERIQVQNLKERLPHRGQNDELDRLTEVFNAMTKRLDDSFEHIREFTLHASHELKTPLTIMRAELELALHEKPDDYHELLVNQLEEIQRLTQIVDGLSLLAKADAGQITLKRVPLCFDDLVEDVFTDAQILAQTKGVEVVLDAAEKIFVAGDKHRLKQLLLNLSDNAIKYNFPNGKVKMQLAIYGGAAELRIANTGAGIPPEKLPRVFDRFFRGDTAHSSEVEGCGLGLSIAEWIVKAHDGTIRLESIPGEWTTLIVRLPLASKPLAEPVAAH